MNRKVSAAKPNFGRGFRVTESAVCLVWFDLISREITQRRPDDFKSPAKIDELIGIKIIFSKKIDIHTPNSCKNYKWSQIWKIATFQ